MKEPRTPSRGHASTPALLDLLSLCVSLSLVLSLSRFLFLLFAFSLCFFFLAGVGVGGGFVRSSPRLIVLVVSCHVCSLHMRGEVPHTHTHTHARACVGMKVSGVIKLGAAGAANCDNMVTPPLILRVSLIMKCVPRLILGVSFKHM